jgi:hypothetical protein
MSIFRKILTQLSCRVVAVQRSLTMPVTWVCALKSDEAWAGATNRGLALLEFSSLRSPGYFAG